MAGSHHAQSYENQIFSMELLDNQGLMLDPSKCCCFSNFDIPTFNSQGNFSTITKINYRP